MYLSFSMPCGSAASLFENNSARFPAPRAQAGPDNRLLNVDSRAEAACLPERNYPGMPTRVTDGQQTAPVYRNCGPAVALPLPVDDRLLWKGLILYCASPSRGRLYNWFG